MRSKSYLRVTIVAVISLGYTIILENLHDELIHVKKRFLSYKKLYLINIQPLTKLGYFTLNSYT